MLQQCIFTTSPVLGRFAVRYVGSLGLSSQIIFRQRKHNGEKRQAAKEYIAICKNPGAAPKRGHHLSSPSTLLVTEMSSLKNKM